MTFPGDPPDLDPVDPVDLDASDLLDRRSPNGRRGAIDDAVLARAAEFDRLRARLVDVPPAEPNRRAATLADALRAFDASAAAPSLPQPGTGGRVLPFARRRRGVFAPAAALVALAAAAAGFVLVGRGPTSDPSVTGGDAARVAVPEVVAVSEDAGARSNGAPALAASPAAVSGSLGAPTALPVAATDIELRAVLGALPVTTAPAACPTLAGSFRGPLRWAPADRVVVVVVTGPRARLVTVDDCLEVTTIAVP